MARVRTSPGKPAAEKSESRIPGIQPEAEAPAAKQERFTGERPRPPWGVIVEQVFSLDVRATYERLVSGLSLGDGATEYGAVLAALDGAERNIFDAVRVARAAKLEDERLAAAVDERLEVMRSAARAELEAEKAAAKAAAKAAKESAAVKAPTLQEVEDRVIATWPDEVRSLRSSKAEMHGALRAAEGLETAWRSRASTLRSMLERFQYGGQG